MRTRIASTLILVPVAALALSGCVAGLLPTLRTERIDVAGVGLQGLTLRVRLSATNERYAGTIGVDTLRVNVTVGGQNLGQVDVPGQWQLPPNQPVTLEADVRVPIQNLPALALQAATGPVPYHLEGNAHVQNLGWSVGFSYDGYVPPEQFLGAATPGLPFALP